MPSLQSIVTCVAMLVVGFGVPTGSARAQQAGELSEGVLEYVSVSAPVVALANVQIVDGTGADPVANQTILIQDGRIAAIGDAGSVRMPDDTEVLDLAGHTVIPGLVGMHNHTFYTTYRRDVQLNYSGPRLYLASGVTTIRTTGSFSPYSEINVKRGIEEGRVPGPRMHITGPYISGRGAANDMYQVNGPEDARRVVAYWAEEGATWFKAYTRISREELAAAIDEAHKRGLKITGHLCSVSFREAVDLGMDNLEHGFFVNTDWDPEKTVDNCPTGALDRLIDVDLESPEVAATIRAMVDNDVAMTSTQAIYELYVPNRPPIEERTLKALAPESREEYLEIRERISATGRGGIAAEIFAKAQAFAYMFAQSGGLLAAGVDPTGIGGALPGYGDQRNFELLIESGFTPVEAIQVMTANGARILGVYDELGSVTEGKIADLVVIAGDPIARPEEIRNVTVVFKDGVGYNSAALIESIEGQIGVR